MQRTFKLLFHKSPMKTVKSLLLFGEIIQVEVNSAELLFKKSKRIIYVSKWWLARGKAISQVKDLLHEDSLQTYAKQSLCKNPVNVQMYTEYLKSIMQYL